MGQSNYREGADEGIFELCRKHGLGSVGAVFLGHDGSMTRLLELSVGGPVSLRTIGQKVVPCPRLPASLLEVRAGEPVNERDILILRSLDERPLLHARSYTPLSHLEPGFRRDMMRADIPIGRIMRAHRIEARREILKSIPGLTLKELENIGAHSICCGGGGNLEMTDPRLSRSIAGKKIKEIRQTGADAVVTSCQQCVRTIKGWVRREKIDLPVMDMTELVLQAMTKQ